MEVAAIPNLEPSITFLLPLHYCVEKEEQTHESTSLDFCGTFTAHRENL